MGPEATNLEFAVLGPLAIHRDGQTVAVGSFKQRAALGMLLVHHDEVVSTDRLIDELWRDDGVRDRQNALWVHISNLRKALQPDVEGRSAAGVLRTRAPGYVLHVPTDGLDSLRFERLVSEGQALLGTDPAAASIVFAEALALWRGRALEDFTFESWAQPEIHRLEELRLEAVENRIDADLRTGRRRELVGELEGLVRRHPDREALTASLMVALYGSGRTSEALRTYRAFRDRLGTELGVEPSAALQQLHSKIVNADPSLDPTSATMTGAVATTGPAVRGYEIRECLGDRGSGRLYRAFQPAVGREVIVKVIRPELADDPQFVQRFEAEAQLVARLEHPHIVPIYDFWREPGRAFVVMRYIGGGTMRQRLADGRPLASEDLARLVDQLGAALETAHAAGVRHGHLTADNVLFDDVGNTYLADFEIAVGSRVAVGDSGVAAIDTEADVRGLAETVAQAATGRLDPLSDLLVGLDPGLAAVLQEAAAPSDATRPIDAAALRAELSAVMREPTAPVAPAEIENPYKGLRSFQLADADTFFGRERFVDRLVARLGRSGPGGRFVAVVGPSGSGKSSVVSAGLLPALRAGAVAGSEHWYTVEMTPGLHPFEELEEALLGVAVSTPVSLLSMLTDDHGVQRAIAHALPTDDARLLLVIDQFEELFTLTSPDTVTRFMDVLEDAVADEHARLKVVVTLRADFYDRPLRHRGLGELMRRGTEVLTPMSPGELERAVTGPAERVGATCEAALVSELVSAASDRPTALPLLQYALTEIFERRGNSNVMRAATYAEVGGIAGALVDRAEAIFTALEPVEQAGAEQVFLRLVALSDSGPPTRRRVLLSELTAIGGAGRFAESIVDTFARHRLVSYDRDPVSRGTTVEIAHEALLTAWSRLARWLDHASADVANQRRLAEAAAEWDDQGRSDDFVLAGGRLATYAGWIDDPPLALTETEHDLLAASDALESSRRADRAAQAARDARLRRRSAMLVGLAVVTVVVIALGAVAVVSQRRSSDLAQQIAGESLGRELAAEAHFLADTDPEQAMATAVEAARATAANGEVLPEAMDAMYAAMYAAEIPYSFRAGPTAVRPAAGGGVYLLNPNELAQLLQDELADTVDVQVPLPPGLGIGGGEERYAGTPSATPLAGTRVSIVTPLGGDLRAAMQDNFAVFTDRTGIEVDVRSIRFGEIEVDAIREDSGFDLVEVAQPGALPEVGGRRTVDLSRYVDRSTLEAGWGAYLTDLMTVGADGEWPASSGPVYGVWSRLDLKTLLWHDAQRFEREGYQPPTTWSELSALSDRIVAAGDTPWCLGLSAGGPDADGWPATDLLESILLRLHGPDVYDRWWRHEIPFDDPEVIDAARLMNELIFPDGYLADGPAAATQTPTWRPREDLVDDPPRCAIAPLGSFERRPGTALTAAAFPAIDPAFSNAEVGAGAFIVAKADRPEVRAVVEFIASPDYGSAAAQRGLGWIPPNVGFDLDLYADDNEREVVATTYEAIRADQFRFDATDMMPASVGSDAAFAAMIEWFRRGPDAVEEIFADVEAQWRESETG